MAIDSNRTDQLNCCGDEAHANRCVCVCVNERRCHVSPDLSYIIISNNIYLALKVFVFAAGLIELW